MEEPSIKYILLRDRVGHTFEKNMLSLGLPTKSTPIQVLRGEILKGAPEAEQPIDSTKVAFVGIELESLRLECPMEDMARLSEEESRLLSAITSSEERYETYTDRKRLAFGRKLSQGSAVFVEVKGFSKFLPGIVWYRGILPPSLGTWFGVELIKHPGSGTCDGTFRNKRYFTCEPDCGVFVGLDKLTPREDEDDLKSSKLGKKDKMEVPSMNFIILRDCFGHVVEKNMWTLGFTTKSKQISVLRGELSEALPEAEQPADLTKVALVGIECNSLRLECPMKDMAQLSEEDTNLLLAITSPEGRYKAYIDRKHMAFGRQLSIGIAVWVEVEGITQILPGTVWYKGVLPPNLGTWFGVELIKHPGSGTCDGTFGNKQYFVCGLDCGVFVGLDKLTPRENEDDLKSSKIAEQDENIQAELKSSLQDAISSFWKGKHEQRQFQGIDGVLKTGERVVTFIEDSPARGTVRYIGEEEDRNFRTIVGLELDERLGFGCGKRRGSQKFVCKRDFAAFVPLETVIPEKDFDGYFGEAAGQEAQGKREQIHEDEMYARSMSCGNLPSVTRTESVKKLRRATLMTFAETELMMAAGESSKTNRQKFIEKRRQMLREFECKNLPSDNQDNAVITHDAERRDSTEDFHFNDAPFKDTSLVSCGQTWERTVHLGLASSDPENRRRKTLEKQRQSRDMEGQLPSLQEKPRENDEEEKSLLERLSEMEQQLTQLRAQLEKKESEKQEQGDRLQRQLREMEQRLADEHERLQEKHNQPVNPEAQVKQMEEQLTNAQGQLQEKHDQLVNSKAQVKKMEEQLTNAQGKLQEKHDQLVNSEAQVKKMEEQLTNAQGKLQEKHDQLVNSEAQVKKMEEQLTNAQGKLQEKHDQLVNSEAQVKKMEEQLTNAQGKLQEKHDQLVNSEAQVKKMEEQLTNAQGQLQEKHDQLVNSETQIREVEEQVTNLRRQLHEHLVNSDVQIREATQQLTNIQEQLQGKDEEIAGLKNQLTELEMTLSTAQQLALNARQRQESPDWVISRDQIHVTDKCLGRGGWGHVVEGKYCGCAVAVKQIHEVILSNHNRSLFEREMNIASRCRHPCLLQFVGATNDEGSPLFVTELMETSLRALLKRPLSATELLVISLDVARALNYLHQKQPSPIIHRDISSANVLLWRQGDQWRAKVSDYGTANFMRHTMTVAPGAPIYSAPEAVTKNQTVKVDVYSFGVLLCEMSIQEMPDPEKREQQVALVTNRVIRALIRGCLQTEPEERPCMEEIIDELEQPT